MSFKTSSFPTFGTENGINGDGFLLTSGVPTQCRHVALTVELRRFAFGVSTIWLPVSTKLYPSKSTLKAA